MKEFLEKLKARLTYAELEILPSDAELMDAINAAVGEINRRRNYIALGDALVAPGYERFVVPMAAAAILKTGMEGHGSYSVNGVSRGYLTDGDYPRDILRQITWKVR